MRPTLSIRSANLLFLLVILLVLVVGSMIQLTDLSWGLLATEFLLILAPTLLALRLARVPFSSLRLRPLSPRLIALFFVLGSALWLVDGLIDVVIAQLSGLPPVIIPEETLPANALEKAVFFLALAVAAPLCEEALFRGAILPAYERERSPRFAIVISALMFAFFHLRLTGLPALLPVAFVLGYAVWRTQSIWAGVIIHFANNSFSGLVSLLGMGDPPVTLPLPSLPSAAAGLVVLIVSLALLRRWVPAPQPAQAPAEESAVQPAPRRAFWSLYWPVLVFGLIYVVVSGSQLAAAFFPELAAQPGLAFKAPDAVNAQTYRYEITNHGDEPVGEAQCSLQPDGEQIHLACSEEVRAYEVRVGNSMWADSGGQREWSAAWDRQSFTLQDYQFTQTAADGAKWAVELEGSQLVVHLFDGAVRELDMPAEQALIDNEWPWRAGYLDIEPGMPRRGPFIFPLQWDAAANENRPAVEELVAAVGYTETVQTPAGKFQAVKVQVGDSRAAWYEAEEPHRLVRWETNMVTYSLAD